MSETLPCPFCDGDADVSEFGDVGCKNMQCPAGSIYTDKRKWNSRSLWRTIESAPSDKWVLGYGVNQFKEEWYCKLIQEDSHWFDPFDNRCHPTHWMPLPAPPTTGLDGAG